MMCAGAPETHRLCDLVAYAINNSVRIYMTHQHHHLMSSILLIYQVMLGAGRIIIMMRADSSPLRARIVTSTSTMDDCIVPP